MFSSSSVLPFRPLMLLAVVALGVGKIESPLLGEDGLLSGNRFSEASPVHMADDVRLTESGQLSGLLVDIHGQGLANESIALIQQDVVLATTTNSAGLFVFDDIAGGTYDIQYRGTVRTIRLWTYQAAPPVAQNALLLATDDPVYRGQQPLGDALMSNPVLFGGILVGAVAVPVIVHNSKSSASGS